MPESAPEAFDPVEWDALVDRSPWATPFSRWAFHRAWWDGYGEGASDASLAVVDDAGRLVGIVPLMRRHEVEPSDLARATALRHTPDVETTQVAGTATALFFGASYHADYATILCAPEDLPGVAEAVATLNAYKAIAVNLREMTLLEVPIIAAVIGEGGSGGALGIGVADRVLILENAYYSVISPEGCAAILWKDRANAAKAAEALKITSKSLLELGLVDEIIPEPLGGAHNDLAATASAVQKHLLKHLAQLDALSTSERLRQRYGKYRHFGHFHETAPLGGTTLQAQPA